MRKLKKYLEMSNYELLSEFKWGDQGLSLFSEFMTLVRDELGAKRDNMIDELQKEIDNLRNGEQK